MPSIPEGEPHGEHPDGYQDCNTARWGTEGRRPDGELGAPNSSSDDGLTAARMADLTNHREQRLADIAASTQVSYLEAAQMAAAKELEMQKIQKAQQEAEVSAKAEMDRLFQEAEDRFDLAAQEEEARAEKEWAELLQEEARAEARVQAEMANASSTLETAEQWQAELEGYEADVNDEGWWDGDRKSQFVGFVDVNADDEGAIRGILFS